MRVASPVLALAACAAVISLAPCAVHARGGDPNGDAWTCLRPHVPEPLIYASARADAFAPPPGGEPRSAWEGEVWQAERAYAAEAASAGGGAGAWHQGPSYPRLSYARELALPPPTQLIVVGAETWDPAGTYLPGRNAPNQPFPMLPLQGENPKAFAKAYAHYHGHSANATLVDAYATSVERQQALVRTLSPAEKAQLYIRVARILEKVDARDDIYAYGSGITVLREEARADPKCLRYSLALLHRAMALIAHLPGHEAAGVRRGVWTDFHHGLASMRAYDDENLIMRRLFLESPAGVPMQGTSPPTLPHALASSRESGMRIAANSVYYVGAGTGETLLQKMLSNDTVANALVAPAVPLILDPAEVSSGTANYDFNFPRTTRARLRHDREQLAYLVSERAPESVRLAKEVGQPAIEAYDEVIAELGGVENTDDNLLEEEKSFAERRRATELADADWLRDADKYMSEIVSLSVKQQTRLAPFYNRHLARRDEPRVPGGALDWANMRVKTLSSNPLVLVVDDVFREDALGGLLRFTRGTSMWTHVKKNGYLCAYPSGGFATPLLGQLAEELPLIAPDLSCGYQLVTSWGYLYDDVRSLGIGVHADIARVNINCWITPDDSNLDKEGGGMVIVPARPPADWHASFLEYNAPNTSDPTFWADLNAQSGGVNITVPHRQNRCVIFDSELYHWTDRVNFRRGYEHRRINLTFLYGHQGDKTCAMRGGGSSARAAARAARTSAGETRPKKDPPEVSGAAKKYPYDSRIPGSRGATEPTVPAEFVVGDRPRQEL